MLGKLAGLSINIAVSLAKNLLTPLATMVLASVMDGAMKMEMCEQGVVRKGEKKNTLVISKIFMILLES